MKTTIIKIGGSVLSNSLEKLFNFEYAYQLKKLFAEFSDQHFILSVGGGFVCRHYQQMVVDAGEGEVNDIHKVGVATTNLNAEILHTMMGNIATSQALYYKLYDELLAGQREIEWAEARVQVVGAAGPGRSNDWNAMEVAKLLKIDKVIGVKNVDGVYTADPRKNPDAQFLPTLTWMDYLNLIGNPAEHNPGASYPVDPIAARDAQEYGIAYHAVGADLDNLRKCIRGEECRGTLVG